MIQGRKIEAIPNEMTKRIFDDYKRSKNNEGFTINAFLKKWGVSRAWFHKKRQQLKQLGHWKTKTGKPGPKKRLLEDHTETLKNIVTETPDATLEEICEKLPVRVSHQTVANELDLLGLVYKKNHWCPIISRTMSVGYEKGCFENCQFYAQTLKIEGFSQIESG